MSALHIKLAETHRSMQTVRSYAAINPKEVEFALCCLRWRETDLVLRIENLAQQGGG